MGNLFYMLCVNVVDLTAFKFASIINQRKILCSLLIILIYAFKMTISHKRNLDSLIIFF